MSKNFDYYESMNGNTFGLRGIVSVLWNNGAIVVRQGNSFDDMKQSFKDIAAFEAEVKQLKERIEELTQDGIWCPRCGEIFHDEDMDREPEKYWRCPLCYTIEHKACRGPISDDAEIQEMLKDNKRLREVMDIYCGNKQRRIVGYRPCRTKPCTECAINGECWEQLSRILGGDVRAALEGKEKE